MATSRRPKNNEGDDVSESEAPSLKIDVGFNLAELSPSLSFELPLNIFKRPPNPFSASISSLKIWWNGRRDGKRGIPDFEGEDLSATERSILHTHQIRADTLYGNAESLLLNAADAASQYRPPAFVAATAVQMAKSSISGWLTINKGLLASSRRAALQRADELKVAREKLEAFVKKHGLSTNRPLSRKPLMDRIGLLATAVVGEALLSMALFSELTDFGLLGGILYAVAVSATNVACGVAVGFLLTYAINIKRDQTFIRVAFVGAGILTLFVLIMNLAVARYRENGRLSWDHMFPETAMSTVLFVLGICIWGLSIYKGWQDFQPDHDGHVDLWRDYHEAVQVEQGARGRLNGIVTTFRASALAEIEAIRVRVGLWEAEHERRLGSIRNVIRAVETLKLRLPEIEKTHRATCDEMLRRYRETNWAVRPKAERGKVKYLAEVTQDRPLKVEAVLEEGKATEGVIQRNQEHLAKFRELFEAEVGDKLSDEIAKAEAEAEAVKTPTTVS
jgi:hypothetical protein